MELSPHAVRATSFKTVKKGYDPDEVEAFREEAAAAIEAAQNQAAAMEARARAAVAKLQELSQQPAAPAEPHPSIVSLGDAETISRTLLLAQRTADTTVAEARAEAEAIVTTARAEAAAQIDSARSMAGRLIDEARQEARRAGEDERLRADNEVQALLAKRDFLLSDVEHLEQFIAAQRERIRDVASALHELADRSPEGLGDMRRPILSAAASPAPPAAPPLAPANPPVAEVPAPLGDLAEIVAAVEAEVEAETAAALLATPEPTATTAPLQPVERRAELPASPADAASDPWAELGSAIPETEAGPALDFSLDVTAEVPVTPSPDPLRLRLGDDTQ